MSATGLNVRPPTAVLDIVRTLQRAGHETWCVGGAVRDALLGHAHLDWDLATAATPPQVRRLFDRTVPVGIEFGTIGVLDKSGLMHEVTTFRRDVQHDGRHAVVEFGASLDEDLARRDFTMNAIAFDPLADVVHDPFGGQQDIARRLVRAVGDPQARMREDRLRALRAIRFASRFDFALDPATWAAIIESAPFLPRLSPERVKQEIEKTMEQVRRPSVAFRRWRDAGAFRSVAPALATIGEAALDAVDCIPKPGPGRQACRLTLRIAVLFSDLSARDAESALRALRFSNSDVAWISTLAGRWQQHRISMTSALCSADGLDARSIRQLVASVGRVRVRAFMRLAAARWSADRDSADDSRVAPDAPRVRDAYRRAVRSALRDPVEIADLALDGDDLRRLGVPPGPMIGRTLASLLAEVLLDTARNSREALAASVRRIMAES